MSSFAPSQALASERSMSATFSGSSNQGLQVGQSTGILSSGPFHYHAASTEGHFRGSYFQTDLTTSPDFVSRPKHQKLIEDQLRDERKTFEHKLLVIRGLGGAGKSQLAVDYLERHRNEYAATFWIDASSSNSITRDFTLLFSLFFPAEVPPPDLDTVISRVKVRLQSRNELRLIVFDGFDEIDDRSHPLFVDIKRFLPRLTGAHVILTTRLVNAEHLTRLRPIQVKELEDDEALALFQNCSRINDQQEPAKAILRELGNYALAITLAGHYILQDPEIGTDLYQYLQMYRQNRDELVHWYPDDLIHPYGETVPSTWQISFNAIKRRSELAARLLTCLSFLDRTDIFLGLFYTTTELGTAAGQKEQLLPSWKEVLSPDIQTNFAETKRCLGILVSYSFVDVTSRRYSLHKLVHEWGLDRLDQVERRDYSCSVIRALKNTIEETTPNWETQARLIPHLNTSFNILEKIFPILDREQLPLLDDLRAFQNVLELADQWRQVHPMHNYRYKTCATLFGEGHHETVSAKNDLANTLSYLGNYAEAVTILQSLIEVSQQNLGDDHLSTISLRINLAATLFGQGKYAEAASIQQESLRVYRLVLGKDHPRTLSAMHSLANSLRELGRLVEAASMMEKVTEQMGQTLGADHPNTLSSLNSLAITLGMQGKLAEALSLKREVLKRMQQAHGDEHPRTISAAGNLATILHEQGQFAEAAAMRREVLQKFQRTIGDEHPDTLSAKNNIAISYRAQSMLNMAAMTWQEVLDQRRQTLGSEHPHTISTMNNLADVLEQQGQLHTALTMKKEVLERRRQIFGEDHLDTISARNNLATTLYMQGKLDEAAEIKQDVLKRRRQILGEDHPDTISAMSNAAVTPRAQGKIDEAAAIEQDVLEKRRIVLGEDHPDTISANNNLAITLHAQGKLDEAALMKWSVLRKRRQILGEDHPDTISAMFSVAIILHGQGKPDEAAAMMRDVLEKRRLILGEDHPDTISIRRSLEHTLSAQMTRSGLPLGAAQRRHSGA